ncbi:hypothetical protein [Planosporangium thailandense]|uniref:hypothetical protein n=1 Tax=Planosporangium thailandense TaxID=765197 RepID=UPI00197CA979|nr:hypothetical protein [Planosporangium thailandense]
MSLTQWILNVGLLAWVLLRNIGARPVTRSTFAVPLLIVGVAAVAFLRGVPTAGDDVTLELAGVGAGVAAGALATAFTRMSLRRGRLTLRAGAAFAAVWVAVIGGRVAFAEWATHSGARAVGEFSMRHHITGADAWTAACVLMALAMVLTRTALTAAVAGHVRRRHSLGGQATAVPREATAVFAGRS